MFCSDRAALMSERDDDQRRYDESLKDTKKYSITAGGLTTKVSYLC